MENDTSRSSSIAAILFDLDNTLIATRAADKTTCNKLSEYLWERHGVPIKQASSICNTFLRNFRNCPDNKEVDLDTWRHHLWNQALGQEYTHLADEIYQKWLLLRYHNLTPTPKIYNLLTKLRQNYMLGLITNGPSNAQWEKVQKLHLRTLFDVILVSGDLPWEKPDLEIFHKACDYLGVEPRQCLMVGDKLETDILGGINAELGGTVWIPLSNSHLDETDPSPDFVLKNVCELPKLLPKEPPVLKIRNKHRYVNRFGGMRKVSIPDFEDCNSNSSDGS